MKKTIALFGIFLVFFLINSAFNQQPESQAETEDVDLAGSGAVSISPSAVLLPNNWFYHKDVLSFSRSGSYFYFDDPAEGDAWAYAPVNLPNAAVVTKFVLYCTDNDDTLDASLYVSLCRHNHVSGNIELLASVTTSGLSASPSRRILKDETIAYAQVKNHKFSYYLYLDAEQISNAVRFHGAKIVYQ